MPTNTLTDTQCRTAKAPDKARKLFDGHGLYLYVTPAGAKVWRVAYRLHSKPQTATLGPYPLVSLAEAREARDALRKQLQDGISPKARTKKRMSFKKACETYWAGRADVTDRYRANALRGLEMHLYPDLGDVPIDEVTRDQLLQALLKMDKLGRHVYVRTVRMWASQVFDWAMEQPEGEGCTSNPAAAIKAEKAFSKSKTTSHAALRETDLPAFMDRLAMEDQMLLSVLGCRMLALTWVRTTELRTMRWDEIEGDLWRIPEGKMKRAVEHLVPLPRQALDLLEKLKLRSKGSVFVFPAEHTLQRPMSENAVLYLLHRMGYKGLMTGHGWRSVVSSWANERGYNPDAIERQLSHTPDDKIRAAYNKAAYLPLRRQMLQDWADWLDAQTEG